MQGTAAADRVPVYRVRRVEARARTLISPPIYTSWVLRRLLTLLLCACLVWPGAGSALASDTPCAMQAELEAMVLAGELDSADLPDCCNDLQTWAETGQLCKPGVDFAGSLAWGPAPTPARFGITSAGGPAALPSPGDAVAPPGAPWRPPTGA